MKKLDPSVLRIPLDEPIININADTRQIELTKEFGKTQLLTVENDHLAETIYFQIDRYFDLQDLAADDIKIYIQYYLNDQVQGYSEAICPDIGTAGKLIFGWQISDEVTSESGTLQFSIIFFKKNPKDNNNLMYVFNTLPAQMVINKTLDIDEDLITAQPVDYLTGYLESLIDSKKSAGFGVPDNVTFLTSILNNKSVYLTGDKLYALAYNDTLNNPDNTTIEYKWICNYRGTNTELKSGIGYEYKKIIEDNSIFSGDMVYNEKLTYFTKNGDSYINSSSDINLENYTAKKNDLYLKVQYCEVDGCGSYSVTAFGATANQVSKEVKWTGLAISVEGISENFRIVLDPSPDNGCYYGSSNTITAVGQNDKGVQCTYLWKKNGSDFSTDKTVTLTKEDNYTLSVHGYKNKDSIDYPTISFTNYFDPTNLVPVIDKKVKIENGKYIVTVTNTSELGNGIYEYQWKNAQGATLKTTSDNSTEVDENITQGAVIIQKGERKSQPGTFKIEG